MQSFPGIPARSLFAARIHPAFAAKIHPALTSFTDEVCATFARLFAYMGTLALLGILTIHGWDQLQLLLADEPAAKPSWSPADRSYPAFAVGGADLREKSASYTILRHPEGGRKDILRWTGPDAKVVAELEIYRPGSEFDPALWCRARGADGRNSGLGDSGRARQQVRCCLTAPPGRPGQFVPRLLHAQR